MIPRGDYQVTLWDYRQVPTPPVMAWLALTSHEVELSLTGRPVDSLVRLPRASRGRPYHFIVGVRWLVELVAAEIVPDTCEHLTLEPFANDRGMDWVLCVTYAEWLPDPKQLTEGEPT